MKPFKRLHTHFIVWLTILVIVGPYVAKTYLIIQFQWNKSDIITTSCIQRNKPKNCCQGSCQLNVSLQILDEQPGKQGNTNIPNSTNEEFSILWMSNYAPSVEAPVQSIDGLFLPFKLKPSDYHSTIEHPPC